MPENACTRALRPSNFLLHHHHPILFVTCQWGWPRLLYVIYRTVIAAYFTTWIILSGTISPHPVISQRIKWFIYLTNWTYFLLTANCIILAATASYRYLTDRRAVSYPDNSNEESDLPWYLKVQWVIYNVASAGSLAVSVGYWGLLWRPGVDVNAIGMNTHAINSFYVLADLFIMAMPLRLLHFWFPLLYGLLYIIFTLIYQAAGGTDPAGRPYIYFVLDFLGNPALAVPTALITMLVGLPALWLFLFGLYSLRVFINGLMCCRCSSYPSTQPPDHVTQDGVTVISDGIHDNMTSHDVTSEVKVITHGAGSVNEAFTE